MIGQKKYFSTFFDSRYLVRGLALHESLSRQADGFELWILCMDTVAHRFLYDARLENVNLIKLEELEQHYPDLRRTRPQRGLVEYYFTCKPALVEFVLKNNPHVDRLTYLDADLFFFAAPSLLDDSMGRSSIALAEHRFAPNLADIEQTGRYNAGWISIKRDANGLACAEWWRRQCIAWCYDRIEDGKYADQKYLDAFQDMFGGVISVRHKGANLAPWNIANYRIHVNDGKVFVDDEPLVFFHFHGLKRARRSWFDSGLHDYRVRMNRAMRERIYRPYIGSLQRWELRVNAALESDAATSLSAPSQRLPQKRRDRLSVENVIHKLRSACLALIYQSYLHCRD